MTTNVIWQIISTNFETWVIVLFFVGVGITPRPMDRETNPKTVEIDDLTIPNYELTATSNRQTRRSDTRELLDSPF